MAGSFILFLGKLNFQKLLKIAYCNPRMAARATLPPGVPSRHFGLKSVVLNPAGIPQQGTDAGFIRRWKPGVLDPSQLALNADPQVGAQ
ncbi:hypothetical protein V5G24_01265 [Xanthobacter sp. VTT E-85241]|uniref:hypothetical protein n=1 Tax=Roseixanthobacter finlandensis TaxID=3119922 RepID=UPI00372C1486